MIRTREEEHAQEADDGNLKRLKKIRGSNRGKVTKLINEACDLMNEGIIDTDISNKLQVKVKSLNEKKEYLGQLDEEILQKCTLDEVDGEVDESTDISSRIIEYVVKINDYLKGPYTTFGTSNASPHPIPALEVLRPHSRAYTPPRPTASHGLYESQMYRAHQATKETKGLDSQRLHYQDSKGMSQNFNIFGKAFDVPFMKINAFQMYTS